MSWSVQRFTGYDNSGYVVDRPAYIISTTHGLIVTTKLQKNEDENNDDDDDKDNRDFEKLTDDVHPSGLLIFNVRKQVFRMIEKRKVRYCSQFIDEY